MPKLTLKELDNAYIVTGKNFSVQIGKDSGAIESFKYGGKQLVSSPLIPNFWRVPTDNDIENDWDHKTNTPMGGVPIRLKIWRDAGRKRTVKNVTAKQPKPQMVEIISQAVLPAGNSDYTAKYIIYGSGDIVIESTFEPGSGQLPELPRFGMQMAIPNEFNTMTWYGRGPKMV